MEDIQQRKFHNIFMDIEDILDVLDFGKTIHVLPGSLKDYEDCKYIHFSGADQHVCFNIYVNVKNITHYSNLTDLIDSIDDIHSYKPHYNSREEVEEYLTNYVDDVKEIQYIGAIKFDFEMIKN